jgi:L-amino acid N-acyltransferase YncA
MLDPVSVTGQIVTATARPAQEADMPAVGAIYVSGHLAAYRGAVPYSSLRALDPVVEGQSLGEELGNAHNVFMVAVSRTGRVIGFAFGGITDQDHALGALAELYIDRVSDVMASVNCSQRPWQSVWLKWARPR